MRSAIAFGLAGFAAAGAAFVDAHAPSAAPVRETLVQSQKCSSGGSGAGQAVRVRYALKVNHKSLSRATIKNGDRVETDRAGIADICLKEQQTRCRLSAGAVVVVHPPGTPWLLRITGSGKPACSMHDTTPYFVRIGNSWGVRPQAPSPAMRRVGASTIGDPVFSLTPGKRAAVKLQRGAAVVARQSALGEAVVLARNQQVVVPAGANPLEPTAIKLTPAERRNLKQVAATLPPDTDRTPPSVHVRGPRDPSSLRAATISFSSSEPGPISCAVDGGDFRFCTTPLHFDRLEPGGHKVVVKATDSSGNTGSTVFSWTIDGSRIAFTSNRDGNLEIYAMDPDGTNLTRLTNNPAADEDPEWSADRKRIVFHSNRNDNTDIYVMNADGSGQTRLTSNPATDRNPTWSPDGRRIAFESYRDGNREIYVMNADGSGQTRLTQEPSEDLDPSWSPDGRKIAFASAREDPNREIYVMNADGSGTTRLTNDPAVEYNPAWSPDGTKIAFHSLRSGASQNIYVMNADGSNVTRLTETGANDYNPAWAPDGGEIVFQSDRDNQRSSQIYIMNADGSGETALTSGDSTNFVPDW
ncbi:MAG: TolB protein [Gaiellaceae bacterium]|jgi:Tol biopolymer transport system component|nr:TolB protein [Gaiellaceae bacterium]